MHSVIETPPVDSLKATCRIDTLENSGFNKNLITITYDDSGRFSKVAFISLPANFIKYYSYKANSVYIYTDMGLNSFTDTVTLNTMGLVSTVKQQSNYGIIHSSYNYDANGFLTSSIIQQEGMSPTTTTYTYINGDLMYKQPSGIQPDTLSYFADKLTSMGDLNNFNQLYAFGAYYDKSKHLLKSDKSDTYINDNYSYMFDADGKITAIIKDNGSHIDTVNVKYHCP